MSLTKLPTRSRPRLHYHFLFFVVILLAAAAFRFTGLNWDQTHYLHPDERLYINARSLQWPQSVQEFFSPQSPLNPHMFYYGSLPLYIYVASFWLSKQITNTTSLLLVSRFISALLSILTIPLVFLIGRTVFSSSVGILAATLLAFSVGSIQYAHYNTTESALTFLVTLITYLALRFLKEDRPHQRLLLAASMGIFLGASIATKITGASMGIIPAITILVTKTNISKKIQYIFLVMSMALLAAFAGSPYAFLDYASFYKEQEYMQGVTLRKYQAPFTIIYHNTIPYVYQLIHIFPWIFSPITLLAAFTGWIGLWIHTFRNRHKTLLVFLLWPTVYFFIVGAWYTKFTRYMVPLLPFLSLFAASLYWYTQKTNMRKICTILFATLLIFHGLWAINFVQTIYGQPHTRIEASDWIYANIPPGSRILGEYWDDTLPLPRPNQNPLLYDVRQMHVYDPDTPNKIRTLTQAVDQSDYIILTSRRVFASIENNADIYPVTSRFYRQLFADHLGFRLIKKFSRLTDDHADESFQSYDHPPVFIFQNEKHLSAEQIEYLLYGAP